MQAKCEALEKGVAEIQNDFDNKFDSLSSKIDEALTESISVLKNDYDNKIGEVRYAVDGLRSESFSHLGAAEAKLDNLIREKVDHVNADLLEKITQIYHSSVNREDAIMNKMVAMEENVRNINEKMESVTIQIDDIQEKMYDFEQNKRNNLIFYGVPGQDRENRDDLRIKISNLLRLHLNIRREIPISKASRMLTGRYLIRFVSSFFTNQPSGPHVHGCRPTLVTFESFKDREDVLKNSKVLGRSQVTVTEDLSKRTRESRQELRKFMRTIKKKTPERHCFLEYDKLYVDHTIYVWNDILGQVCNVYHHHILCLYPRL